MRRFMLLLLLAGCASEVTPERPPVDAPSEPPSAPDRPPADRSDDSGGSVPCGGYVRLRLPDGGGEEVLIQCPDLSDPGWDPV